MCRQAFAVATALTCTAFFLAGPRLLLAQAVQAQRFPAFDPERIFMVGDADLDGRLSLDEFRELYRSSPRMKNAAATIEPLFRRLDTDHDGFLSLREYRKFFPGRPGGATATPDSAKEKPSVVGDVRASATEGAPISREQEKFFEAKIRPVLVTHCGKCHSRTAEKLRGGLRLDSRDGLRRGGDSGPAIVPGKPEESLILRAIRYRDEELRMPPKGKLPDAVVADFEAWVKMGAPDPRIDPTGTAARPPAAPSKGREFWSFRPPKKAPPPASKRADWPRGDIDRFLLAELEAHGLSPVADAERSKLLRRVTFDLLGLPPTPEEADAFLRDDSHEALARVVDRLLASPRFGERWGRHWLDVARFAESSGKTNFTYPQAWRYRDWVIASFNADTPYDRFVRAQIAGDLLPAGSDRQRADQLIATGFLAIGSKAHDAENRGQFVLDLVDEQIEATTRAFLGLTVACARCHDHKMDPISQKDYYALAGIFRSTQTCSGTLARVFPNFNASPLIELPAGAGVPSAVPALTAGQRAAMEQRVASMVRERDAIPPGEANRDRLRRVNSLLAMQRYRLAIDRPGGSPRAFAMGVRERDEFIDSPLYARGELDQPRALVPRGLIQVLCAESTPPIAAGSGRRELADWLATPANPLTARVIVNRVWLHLFGRGLVPTPDNFGAAGRPPSHPKLLDTLAVDFMADGWSIKKLIRRIVLSRAYGLDSAHDPQNFEADPDNALVWRMSKRRLEAEAVRDALLFVGGRLTPEPPVGSAVARTGEGLAFFLRVAALDASDTHRSVYLPVVRDQVLESLALFDFADPSLVTGERATTTSPAQALYFMNSPFVIRQAEALAERVCVAERDDARRVHLAYRLAFARPPTGGERDRALAFLRDFAARAGTQDRAGKAWPAFCQALFAGAEFRYLD
jgi:cytochrome c553